MKLYGRGIAPRKGLRINYSIPERPSAPTRTRPKERSLAKLGISRKESWETIYWLKLGIATGILAKEEAARDLDEAQQLKAMITSAIKTGQSSTWRGDV